MRIPEVIPQGPTRIMVGVFTGVAAFLWTISPTLSQEQDAEFPSLDLEFFETSVRPLLVEHCYECHSHAGEKLNAGLYLDSRKGHIQGGDSGEAIVPGKPEESLLIEAVKYESYEMPPKGMLSEAEIQILEKWVRLGAPWPQEAEPTDGTEQEEFDLKARRNEHWVWQAVRNPDLPKVNFVEWPKQPLDYFVLRRLEDANLQPVEDAEQLALLRRVYFDLIGLPPSVEVVREFMSDTSPDRLTRIVDQLLESPRFGERWGRHWLDLVRYAESRGHEFDNDTRNAHQYRDYIIRALNEDVAYDQLIREHIAGDLLNAPRIHPDTGGNESILGTGFWFLGEWVHSPVDIRKDESDRFDNMIDVMSKTFLGVTVACARCHDHKFDAISTNDYYALSGYLQSSDYRQVRFESMEKNRAIAEQLSETDSRFSTEIIGWLASRGIERPPAPKAIESDAIVVDYAAAATPRFMQNGYIFGDGPRQAGEPFVQEGSVQIATHTSAASRAFWKGLTSITEGKIHDGGKLASLPMAGRTLRTPTFDLENGELACKVQGKGHVVAVVDSHRLIAGPLHGGTVVRFDANANWVRLNLNRYVGHRIHLEFIPDQDATVDVRLIVQGLDGKQLNELDQQLQELDAPFLEFASAAEEVLRGKAEEARTVFADFESGSYDGWTATGNAFGDLPHTGKTIASYQGDVKPHGKWFVNSHNVRSGGATSRSDEFTGTLTSAEFTIDSDAIEFLVGGGAHAGKTCINLLIDGEVVKTSTGKNSNQMSLERWDVRALRGARAKVEVVDAHQGGWGNIGVDHICFVDTVEPKSLEPSLDAIVERWKNARNALHEGVTWESRLAPAIMDGTGEDDHVLIRGNSSKPGDIEPRHFLTAVTGNEPMQIHRGSGRLELADEINRPENPLTHRVAVNRIWHHLMGRGLVPTTDDFGVLGQRPTHPDLLDHLASKFLADGRSIKSLIRYIVVSRTYQLSSRANPAALELDPKNLLLHYCPPKRVEGEVIRDSLLAISGQLDTTPFGPPVPIHLTPFMDGRGRPGINGPLDGNGRRSIYIAVRRNFLSPFMLAFDTPVPFSTMGRRNVSNVPAQALILMNDPFVVEQAKRWAERAMREAETTKDRIGWLYNSGFGRNPTEQERTVVENFLGTAPDATKWADLAHALVNSKEFIFIK